MERTLLYLKSLLALLTLATLFGLVTASAQVAPSQGDMRAAPQNAAPQQRDNDTTRGELANFDRFMDGHPEMAEQLRRDPSLVRNEDFVRDHRDLQEYLQQHPGVREEIKENPDRFMHQEQRYDRREDQRDSDQPQSRRDDDRRDLDRPQDRRDEDRRGIDRPEDRRDNDRRDNDRRDNDTTRGELASFDRFMDSHREISEQLRKDPSLVKNENFVRDHRDLQEYLQQHPGVREEISENPDRFMHQEQRYDRREDQRDSDQPQSRRDEDQRDFNRPEGQRDNDRQGNDRRDNDTTRGELASFDHFMDGHPEIAEQLRRDPSLAKNQEFVQKHPALQEYLQQHPGTGEEISENPNRFMRQEQRFDRFEDNRNHDMSDGDRAGFGEFLGSHSSIAQELSKDPGLVNNDDYQKRHPELQQYLKAHPGVQQQLRQNPQVFVKSTQQPLGSSPAAVPKTPTVDPMPKTVDPMPKQ